MLVLLISLSLFALFNISDFKKDTETYFEGNEIVGIEVIPPTPWPPPDDGG